MAPSRTGQCASIRCCQGRRSCQFRTSLVYDDLKRAILQRVGRNPEQHRQRFSSLELWENGRPFVMTQQLRDACRRRLLAGEGGVDQIIDRVVLEAIHCAVAGRTQCSGSSATAWHRWTWPSNSRKTRWWHATGFGEALPSVSLSPHFLTLSPYPYPSP